MKQFEAQVIIITGTPGVGKTSVAIELGNKGYDQIGLNDFIIQRGLYFGYDFTRESVIIDEVMVEKEIINLTKKIKNYPFFIEGHTTEIIPLNIVKQIFVLRCNPGLLRERLKLRGYPSQKIAENVQAEIMDLCFISHKERFRNTTITEIDTSNSGVIQTVQKIIAKL